MYLSLAEAGKMVGKDKTTLLRGIRAGKLSAERDEHGQWRIQAAEVTRVYPPVARSETQPAVDAAELACTRLELSGARALLEQLREQLRDVLADRDHWREQAQGTQRLLTDQRQQGESPVEARQPRSWLLLLMLLGVGVGGMLAALIALAVVLQGHL